MHPPLARALLLLLLTLFASIAPTSHALSSPPDRGDSQFAIQNPKSEIDLFLPLQARSGHIGAADSLLISAFVPDGLASNDADEAFALQNTGRNALFLGGWQVTDGEGRITLPDLMVTPDEMVWCAKEAAAFAQQWGFAPDCEYGADSDPNVPNATGSAPRLANTGDELQLLEPGGNQTDAVVYAGGDSTMSGWTGPAVGYYQRNTRFARAGQVFYRLFDPTSLLPLTDTNTAADWAQGNPDPVRGRRAAYPGWDLYALSTPTSIVWETPPNGSLLVTPDNAYLAIRDLFASAQHSILLESYEFEHPGLVATLVERVQAGVEVRLLLEGGPTGGLSDDARWAAQQISEAGGSVHFMVNDVADAHDRYPYQHAKFAIIDGTTLLVSTENFKTTSMPPDASDGDTLGRRGYALILHDPNLAAQARVIFELDNDLAHPDIFPWQSDHPKYGAPPSDYTPPTFVDQSGYSVRYPRPHRIADATAAHLFTSPESSLTPGPLLDLINQAGPGDVILTQQLYEHPFWGATDSNPTADPNPRLEALIDAARRGASVRIFLDDFFDSANSARSNVITKNYVNGLAQEQGWDIRARLGNPTGAGVHAKLHLLAIGSQRWIVLGSINGGEVSNKLNRELAIALESKTAYDFLAGVFWEDWSPPPLAANRNPR